MLDSECQFHFQRIQKCRGCDSTMMILVVVYIRNTTLLLSYPIPSLLLLATSCIAASSPATQASQACSSMPRCREAPETGAAHKCDTCSDTCAAGKCDGEASAHACQEWCAPVCTVTLQPGRLGRQLLGRGALSLEAGGLSLEGVSAQRASHFRGRSLFRGGSLC